MSNAKGYAQTVLDGYADTLKRLAERYNSAVKVIDSEHDMIKRDIDNTARKEKNYVDASNKVSLHNTKSALLDRGLSKSGVSVQSDISHNLAKNNAFSEIEANAAKERAENENARAKAKASAFSDYVDKVSSAEQKKNEAYAAQLNKDRDYEAGREDEKFDRYVENRDYEADREDEKFDRYVENREYEADREDEKFDRYVENREYEADREDERFDRYVENREYEADREDERYDRYADNRDYEAKREDEKYDRYADGRDFKAEWDSEIFDRKMELMDDKEEKPANDGVVPNISPTRLVDRISSEHYSSKGTNKEKIKSEIEAIINDTELSSAYRYEVKIYAKALGLI